MFSHHSLVWLGVGVARFLRRWRHHYVAASPPSPTLPHKKGGSRPSSPLAPISTRTRASLLALPRGEPHHLRPLVGVALPHGAELLGRDEDGPPAYLGKAAPRCADRQA